MIVDTSALLAYFDRLEATHEAVSAVIDTARFCVVSPYVVAEVDYLVSSRYGRAAELAVLRELLEGEWELATLDKSDMRAVADLLDSYDDVVGVADASNIVLAERYRCDTIATLDRRHFSYLHLRGKRPLRILP